MRNFDDCEARILEYGSPKLPDDISLPFLAYGFYKPHQLAFSRIKKFIYNKPTPVKINYELNHVNGMPVLENKIRENADVNAYIMEFKHAKQKKAYRTICYGKNAKIYEWNVINVNNQKVNVLMN